MQGQSQWYQARQQWRKPTKPLIKKPSQTYDASQLTIDLCDQIGQVIISTRGPYPKFQKRINLADLVQLVEEVWDDDDD